MKGLINFVSIICIALFTSCNSNSQNVYENTPVSNLFSAILTEDTTKIAEILKKHPEYASYPEQFDNEDLKNHSILIAAIKNAKYKSVEMLLSYGANPNYMSENGKTALFYATQYNRDGTLKPLSLSRILLSYGANPNYIYHGYINQNGEVVQGQSPLLIACQTGNIDLVKLLIEYGAKADQLVKTPGPNFSTETSSPLEDALDFKRMDIAKYLIIDEKVDLRGAFGENVTEEKRGLIYHLRKLLFLYDSENYRLKQHIIDYVENQGFDYRSSPIPEMAVNYAKKNYPESWREYLDKY